jgi:hypothetical protein
MRHQPIIAWNFLIVKEKILKPRSVCGGMLEARHAKSAFDPMKIFDIL